MQILAQLPAESEPTISTTALLELLKNADPDSFTSDRVKT